MRTNKPAKCECVLCCRPIAHCEMMPNGVPGCVEINGTEYAVSILGYLPPAPHQPVIEGYRFRKFDGECHDVRMAGGSLECDCGDYEYRRRFRDPRGCKHCIAARTLLTPPVDQLQTVAAISHGDWEPEDL